ncbi:MAG: tRNA uridine-5-carboxymethylaminomethyl(34) synthesis enzyme MnmG, partial [Bacteroidales bacterium]|nr:tRNA uridine-5-carboxymethylaminomethyl(34) synthesis enzyme MnmG [Bacteroidales bacterium]
YIGVLIDDLVTKVVDEPYRMFTSRAEYRIILRQDNADLRLTGLAHEIGLASEERYALMQKKYDAVNRLEELCNNVNLSAATLNSFLEENSSATLTDSRKISDLATRPELELQALLDFVPRGTFARSGFDEKPSREVCESAEINIKYRGYIDRELRQADKMSRLEDLAIPSGFDFSRVSGLSIECRQKLERYKPASIAQASRISGISPSDIAVLLVYFGR